MTTIAELEEMSHSMNVDDFLESIDLDEESLEHFGRLGMKWGVHIFGRDRGGYSKHKAGSKSSNDHARMRQLRKKGAKHMTNDELSEYNKRAKLEKTYRELTTAQKEANQSEGRKFAKTVLKASGTAVATEVTTALLRNAVNRATKKK